MARSLGRTWMPWQQGVADVALEVDPVTGRFVYREVWLTIPRQSGKTTLILPVAVLRSKISKHLGGRQEMLYAAQTRNDARKKWEKAFVEDLAASRAMRGKYRVRLSNGSEHVRFIDGSTFGPIATTEKAGHGETLDLGALDEVFAQVDDRVEQAWRPAMITRPSPQFWGVSTAGNETSVYLLSKVKAGRKVAEAGVDTGVAYFEWAADPDADPGDPATWWSCMPALGHTVTQDVIAAEYLSALAAGNLNLFRRAYLNQWVDRDVGEQVIPEPSWLACRDEESELVGEPAFAIEVSPSSASAAIACAGYRADGLLHLEVIEDRPGTEWLADRLLEITRRWTSLPVKYNPAGPAGALVADLEAAGVVMEAAGSREVAQACGGLFNDVVTLKARHIGQPNLDASVAGGRKRDLVDAWVWTHKASASNSAPLIAVTLARAQLLAHPQITSANVYVV